uniref:Uncharacterized protein n=1 Tax=Rhizophora mucronata TaxID=61149 RepID=A0A2P2P4U3_RHIMU
MTTKRQIVEGKNLLKGFLQVSHIYTFLAKRYLSCELERSLGKAGG